jgi:hypothetical protein
MPYALSKTAPNTWTPYGNYRRRSKRSSPSWAAIATPLDKLIDRADQDTLLRLLIDLPLAEDVAGKFSYGQKVELVAKAYGVDIEAVTKLVVQAWEEKKRISYAKRDARLAKEQAKVEAARAAYAIADKARGEPVPC